jgi:ribonuclease D
MTTRLHRGDLPDIARYKGAVAIDTETMGLDLARDRLCVVQLSPGDGSADVVQIPPHAKDAPNLKRLLADKTLLKIFHFARFDLGMLYKAFGVMPEPVYCTKIASRLSRTYTDKHGLKDLVREILGQEISKQQQSSDWGATDLTDAQVAYAASDVTHLHALKDRLDAISGSFQSGSGWIWRVLLPTTFSPIRESVWRALATKNRTAHCNHWQKLALPGPYSSGNDAPLKSFAVALVEIS